MCDYVSPINLWERVQKSRWLLLTRVSPMTPCMVVLDVAARVRPWKLLLECSILPLKRFSSFLLVVFGELFSHSASSHVTQRCQRCIRFFARIRNRYTRCIRIAVGCFTDSTIATGSSTTGAPGRFRSDSTVSPSRVVEMLGTMLYYISGREDDANRIYRSKFCIRLRNKLFHIKIVASSKTSIFDHQRSPERKIVISDKLFVRRGRLRCACIDDLSCESLHWGERRETSDVQIRVNDASDWQSEIGRQTWSRVSSASQFVTGLWSRHRRDFPCLYFRRYREAAIRAWHSGSDRSVKSWRNIRSCMAGHHWRYRTEFFKNQGKLNEPPRYKLRYMRSFSRKYSWIQFIFAVVQK